LELYALHKESVSGDAPSTFSSTASGPERAKYQAWRSKSGLGQSEAMRLYLQESDRQIRVYGSAVANPQTPQVTPNTTNSTTGVGNPNESTTPRGLAAIPLLCAAAAESRDAYLRRLSQTPLESAWWGRQEALCGTPGTLSAVPETVIIQLAKMVEHWSLTSSKVVSAFLWPLHNSLLALWTLVILWLTLLTSSWSILQILVWGARRTGISLTRVWQDDLGLTTQSISGMCEPHQAMTCRVVGLVLLPVHWTVGLFKTMVPSMTFASLLFVASMLLTWWYWLLVLPWLSACLLGAAIASGACFAVIEFAGV
jgi:acyl-CoA-binding protein